MRKNRMQFSCRLRCTIAASLCAKFAIDEHAGTRMNLADHRTSPQSTASDRRSRAGDPRSSCATPSSTAGWRPAPSSRRAKSARCSTSAARWRARRLQMLTFEGLVRTERNRGAFVANPSPEEARQIFATRRLIEPGIATAAAERIIGRTISPPSGSSSTKEGRPAGRARPERAARRDQGVRRFPPAACLGRRQRHPAALHGRTGRALVAGHRALRPLRRLELRPRRAPGDPRRRWSGETASAPPR